MACACASPGTTGSFFSKEARRYARQFKKNGLAREQRLLIDAVCRHPVAGASVLEIGCGVGGLHLTLLQRGAGEVTGIDIAEGMVDGAKLLAADLGFAGRTRYLLGDAVARAAELPQADLVVMDKVVCCYENLPSLLATAFDKTRSTLALTYPRPVPFIRFAAKTLIGIRKLFRRAFVPSWHDWDAMATEIEKAGFRERERSHSLIWAVVVFDRNGASNHA